MTASHLSNRWLPAALPLAVCIWALACGEPPTEPRIDGIAIVAAKGGNGNGGNGGKDDVTVRGTDPPGAPQDTRLVVKVTGSGFDETSKVAMLLDEQATDDITTNSTTFVSSREVNADITIAPDAAVDLFDVEVTAFGGRRRGIGIELFEVTAKSQECQLGFDLTFDDSNPVRSDDGSGMYTNGVDKVAVFTGSGDGFRFDTNGDQKVEWKTDIRRVTLDFTGTVDKDGNSLERLMETDAAGDPVPKGIDLRFKQGAVHTDGLNLCALDHEGISGPTSGTVAVGIAFIDSSDPDFKIGEGNNARLSYGDIGGPNVDVDCSIVDEVKVTRTAVDTWELESTDDACLVLGGPLERVFAGEVPMPFKFTIVAQP